jgi:hypothetical protein
MRALSEKTFVFELQNKMSHFILSAQLQRITMFLYVIGCPGMTISIDLTFDKFITIKVYNPE